MTESPFIETTAVSKEVQKGSIELAAWNVERSRPVVIKPAVIKRGKVIKKAVTKPAT